MRWIEDTKATVLQSPSTSSFHLCHITLHIAQYTFAYITTFPVDHPPQGRGLCCTDQIPHHSTWNKIDVKLTFIDS